MGKSRTENTIRNSIADMCAQVIALVAKFVTQSAFIFTLGKEYTGVSGVFSDVLFILSATELGLGSAVLFSMYKPVQEKNNKKISAYVTFLGRVYRVIALVIIILGGLLIPFLKYFIKDVPNIREDIRLIFVLFIAKSAISYLFMNRGIYFDACQKKRVVSLVGALVTICTTMAEVFVLVLLKQYILFLIIEIIGEFLKKAVVALIYQNRFGRFATGKCELEDGEKKNIWKNVGYLSLYRFSHITLSATDSVIISTMFGTAVVGLLTGYRMTANYVTTFAGLFFFSAQSSLGNATVSVDSKQNHLIFRRMSFALFAITCITSACLFTCLTPFVYAWLGTSYCFPVNIVVAVVLNYYTYMMMIVNTTYRDAYGLFKKMPVAPVAMTATNIGLSIVLGMKFGILGVLVATSVARFATLVWVDPFLLNKYAFEGRMKHYALEFAERLLLTVFVCGGAYMLTRSWPYSFSMLLLRALVAVIISTGILILRFGRTDEFAYAVELAKKIVNKFLKKKK